MPNEADHRPESPLVERAIRQAQEWVKQMCTALQLDGWDAVVISLTRVVEVAPGEFRAPGATATVIDKSRCGPVAAQIAEVMRKQADMIERHAEGRIESGYIQDQTNYASGMREWPK